MESAVLMFGLRRAFAFGSSDCLRKGLSRLFFFSLYVLHFTLHYFQERPEAALEDGLPFTRDWAKGFKLRHAQGAVNLFFTLLFLK